MNSKQQILDTVNRARFFSEEWDGIYVLSLNENDMTYWAAERLDLNDTKKLELNPDEFFEGNLIVDKDNNILEVTLNPVTDTLYLREYVQENRLPTPREIMGWD